MASELDNALKQFEAVQANISKLEKVWAEIEKKLPDANSPGISGNPAEFRELTRTYRHIAGQMPAIDGFRLTADIIDPDEAFSTGVELLELGEPSATFSFLQHIAEPGNVLDEYKYRVELKRRELGRDTIEQTCASIDGLLAKLTKGTEELSGSTSIGHLPDWGELHKQVKSIGVLLGETARKLPRWDLLSRHLRFGQKHDLDDIVGDDWPAVRAGLEKNLYGPRDAIPVEVTDLGTLVASRPRGPVSTELNWSVLTAESFERLLFNIVDRTEGYENPEWLTHTNAPDRGRDVSVYRVRRDALSGTVRQRVVIACKKQDSVSLDDVTKLKEQMSLWGPPRVDELILATTGRFTTDAVQWVERHNSSDTALRIEMWPESQLERLLAERPELIAEFGLRGSS